MASDYKPIAVFVLMVVVGSAVLALLSLEPGTRLRLGEKMVYGIYVEGERVGSWGMGIENRMTTLENVPCYRVNYTMELGRVQQGGWIEFDEDGELRHTRVWYYLDNVPRWATEIAYSYPDNLMRVRVENHENLDENGNPSAVENFMFLQKETMTAEHLWYLLRLEPLELGYSREFDLNAFPDAMQTVPARVDVVGEQRVETPVGTFDCWLVQGQGSFDWMWVEKNGRLVAKVQEQSAGLTRTFVLEGFE